MGFFLSLLRSCLLGYAGNVMDIDIESEISKPSSNYLPFCTNVVGKGMNLFHLSQAMG